ncbi:MAG TPA: GNAT family N-acetyltransferase [Polyangiaceae bacterium]|jgi:GNAT superfamily N-acetyltransferase
MSVGFRGGLPQGLSVAELAENVALSRSVGWPDDDADWRVLYATAFALGVREGGALIAQGALGRFEPNAGTIAKMVVAPEAQRRRLGCKILDELIAIAQSSGLTILGLVATPLGQALYASRGFEVSGEITVFHGTPALDRASRGTAALTGIEPAIAFERRFVSCSRAQMLSARFREMNAAVACSGPSGELAGFALATPKAGHTVLGPIWAEDEATARELVRAVCTAISGPIRLDVPASQSTFRAWLSELGLAEKGVRAEMARGGPLPWQVPERFALATQAWG